MEVLSSRVLLRPSDLERSVRFYEETLGLAVYREWGEGRSRSVVFFLGGGLLEVSGSSAERPSEAVRLFLQVRDLRATRDDPLTITTHPRHGAFSHFRHAVVATDVRSRSGSTLPCRRLPGSTPSAGGAWRLRPAASEVQPVGVVSSR